MKRGRKGRRIPMFVARALSPDDDMVIMKVTAAFVVIALISWNDSFNAAAAVGNRGSNPHLRKLLRNHHRGQGNTNFLFSVAFQHQRHIFYNRYQQKCRYSQQKRSSADCHHRSRSELFFFSSSPETSLQQRQQSLQQRTLEQNNTIRNNNISNIQNDDNNNCDYRDESNNIQLCQRTLDAALSKFAIISQPHFASTFNKHRIDSVQVKTSNIVNAGMGLFATKNIKKGSIVSFYPVGSIGIEDVMERDDHEGRTTTTIVRTRRRLSKVAQSDDEEGKEGHNNNSSKNNGNNQVYLMHLVGNRLLMKMDVMKDLGGSSIFINVDNDDVDDETSSLQSGGNDDSGGAVSFLSSSVGFDSHRVNDGAIVLSNTEFGALSYYQASRAAANCVHVPFGPSPLLATVTTRKVNKGEELLSTYGCSYWLDSLMRDSDEEETDMTESIILEAKQVAMDIFKGMKEVAVTHASEAEILQAMFDAP